MRASSQAFSARTFVCGQRWAGRSERGCQWAAADRLLQVFKPLIERMVSWLRRAGLSADLTEEGKTEEGKDILRDAREVISTSKPEGEGPGSCCAPTDLAIDVGQYAIARAFRSAS